MDSHKRASSGAAGFGTALLAVVLSAADLGVASALSTDSEQKIEIEADQAEADDAKGITIYRGRVVIVQGSLRIRGDVVTIHFDEQQNLVKLVAEGDLADFRQQPDGEAPLQNAEAKRLEFHADKDTIVMLGNAHSWQGEKSIRADRIVYDTLKGQVKADAAKPAEGEPGRVIITLPGKKKP